MPDEKPMEQIPFRLSPETVADLDLIAEWLADRHGDRPRRVAALRYAVREVARKIRKNPPQSA
jgi:plasmid stabilization system protein ParE